MRTTNYSWRVYGKGGPENPSCQMDAYITDPSHTPPSWQQTLQGQEREEAIIIVEQDKWAAEQIPDGEGYTQWTINDDKRWYGRTSKQTGNSWEVVLDDGDNELPNPCFVPPPNPKNVSITMANCTLSLEFKGQQVTQTITGTTLPATA